MQASNEEKRLQATVEVCEALGRAMAQWGTVENELYLLYTALTQGGDFPNNYTVIYDSVVHLENKLTMIDALIAFRLAKDTDKVKKWSTLLNKLKRKARNVRNKLAHWRVWVDNRDADNPRAFLGPPLFVPSHQDPSFGKTHGGAMNAEDLLAHANRFTELTSELEEFTDSVCIALYGKSLRPPRE